jgi:hypothetical protein
MSRCSVGVVDEVDALGATSGMDLPNRGGDMGPRRLLLPIQVRINMITRVPSLLK